MVIGVGLIENDLGTLYNSYVVAEPDGSWHVHRKIHAFESEHIASGDRYTVFDSTLGCKPGVLICWDNNLVENVRMTALLVPTSCWRRTRLAAPHPGARMPWA